MIIIIAWYDGEQQKVRWQLVDLIMLADEYRPVVTFFNKLQGYV